jgi:hypothetical protein
MFTLAGTVVCEVDRPYQCCVDRVKGGDTVVNLDSHRHIMLRLNKEVHQLPPPPLAFLWNILIHRATLQLHCPFYVIWFVSVEVNFFKPEVRIVHNRMDPRSKGHFTIQGKQLENCDFGLCKYEVRKCLNIRYSGVSKFARLNIRNFDLSWSAVLIQILGDVVPLCISSHHSVIWTDKYNHTNVLYWSVIQRCYMFRLSTATFIGSHFNTAVPNNWDNSTWVLCRLQPASCYSADRSQLSQPLPLIKGVWLFLWAMKGCLDHFVYFVFLKGVRVSLKLTGGFVKLLSCFMSTWSLFCRFLETKFRWELASTAKVHWV